MKELFGRWYMLYVYRMKQDYKMFLLWILGLGLFSAGFIPAFEKIATDTGLNSMYYLLQNPAMIAVVGPTPVKEAGQYTLGAMYSHQMLLFCSLFSFILTALYIVNRTRKEEEDGTMELMRSFSIGRLANSLSVVSLTVTVNVILSLFIGAVMLSFQVDTITLQGVSLFASSIGLSGILGGLFSLVTSQVMPTASWATGASLGVMGLLYIARGISDLFSSGVSQYNPLAWSYLTYPFTENNRMFLLFSLIFILILGFIAFILEANRDLFSSYFPEKKGQTHLASWSRSISGLFVKLNQGLILSWFIAFLILAASYGSVYGEIGTFLSSNDLVKVMFSQTDQSLELSFTMTIMMMLMCLVAVLPLTLINRLFLQEKQGYLSQVNSTQVKRSQLYWTHIILALVTSIISLFIVTGGLGITALSTMTEPIMTLKDFLIIGINLLPLVILLIGLSSLFIGWFPQHHKLVYIYLVYTFFVNYFVTLLNIPNWILKTTPQGWLSKEPLQSFDWNSFILVILVGLVLVGLGLFGYLRRDLIEEG